MKFSEEALQFRARVEAMDQFLSTCDGGDIGSKNEPSTWLMGVEPGWSMAQKKESEDASALPDLRDDYNVEMQLGWPFNRTAFKLLTALEGGDPDEYESFAKKVRPFEKNSKGYFKANLFPVPLHKLSVWHEVAIQETGFAMKSEYQAWLRKVRFPIVSEWLEECRPKLLIGTGIAHLDDFMAVVKSSNVQRHTFSVNGYEKRLYVASDGVVPLVVLPHLTGGPNGLNSNAAIEEAAKVIKSAV